MGDQFIPWESNKNQLILDLQLLQYKKFKKIEYQYKYIFSPIKKNLVVCSIDTQTKTWGVGDARGIKL